jgi:oligoendopeptidase F
MEDNLIQATEITPTDLSWNLGDYYAGIDDPNIESDFANAEQIITSLTAYRGKMATLTPSEHLALLQQWEELSVLFDNIASFASLLESTNVGVAEITRFSKKIQERITTAFEPIIFIETELAQLPEEAWQTLLHAPELTPYSKLLQKTYRASKHTLSEAEERILNQKYLTSNEALNHIFSVTTNTLQIDWDGKTFTLEELINKISDADPATREKAAKLLATTLNTNEKTTPAILNALVQDKAITDRLRHYDYPEQARFHSDDVDQETVYAMLAAVDQSRDMIGRYYALKKKILKVDHLYWWDRYAPLPEMTTKIPLETGKQMVIDAFTDFSPEVGEIATNMFTKKHVDWLPNKTKRGGAFCSYGSKAVYPYVLLNYTETPRDIATVAHELGHAVHDVYASQHNQHLQAHASLALAEIASTFGESLLLDRLIKSDSLTAQDRISLLMSSIEDRFATIFRQVTMFQFEQKLHSQYRENGELSKEEIDQLWHDTMKQGFDTELEYTDEHKNTWMYVGHLFHWPFYVYSYSFAQLCTLALVQQYKEEGTAFVPKYIEILKAGGSLSPKDNLARAGLDVTDKAFWAKGLATLEQSITELEQLLS